MESPQYKSDFVYKYRDRMSVITPVTDEPPAYTLLFLCGMAERASDYTDQFMNPEKARKPFVFPMAKYGDKSPFDETRLPGKSFRLIFFQGQNIPVSRVQGQIVPAWFDVRDLPCDEPTRYNMDQCFQSVKEIADFINEEVGTYYNGDSSKLFVTGFSMGACLAQSIYLLSHLDQELVMHKDLFSLKTLGTVLPRLGGSYANCGIVFPHLLSFLEKDLRLFQEGAAPLVSYIGTMDSLYDIELVQEWNERVEQALEAGPEFKVIEEEGLVHEVGKAYWAGLCGYLQERLQLA